MKRIISFLLIISSVFLTFSGCAAKHEHNFVLVGNYDLLCTQGGEQLFMCECGDTYKETVKPHDHVWGEWTQTLAPSKNSEGTQNRICTACKVEEIAYIPRTDLKSLFKEYAEFFYLRGLFNSINDLSVNDVFLLFVTHDFWRGPFLWNSSDYYTDSYTYRYFTEEDLNELSKKYFDKTYDWSQFKTIKNPKNLFSNKLYYEEKKNRIVSQLEGCDGIGGPNYHDHQYTKYEQLDEITYKIYYKTKYHELDTDTDDYSYKITTYKRVLTVKFIDGKFKVVAHQKQ